MLPLRVTATALLGIGGVIEIHLRKVSRVQRGQDGDDATRPERDTAGLQVADLPHLQAHLESATTG